MSIQTEITARTMRLQAILDGANARITAKEGTAASDLNGLPNAIDSIPKGGGGGGGGGSGEGIEWKDITVTPEAYEVKVTAPEGFGIRSVTIPAEEDYVGENILLGAELWGLKGTHRVGTQLPAEYMDYLTEGVIICGLNYTDFMDSVYVKGGHNFFLAEDETYITIGFMPAEGISITEYNPGSTEFNSYGWVGYRRSKTGDEWAVEDHRLAENAGSCFAQNIKYATSYIDYEGMTLFPVGINNYPDTVTIDYSDFDNGSFTETIETGDTLEYAVEIDGDTIKVTAADGSIVTAEGIPQGGGESDPNVIKVDYTKRVWCYDRYCLVKLADEPFRTNPDEPIEFSRFGKATFTPSPLMSGFGNAEYDQRIYSGLVDACKTPTDVNASDISTYDGYEAQFVALPYIVEDVEGLENEYFIRVTADQIDWQNSGVIVTKGLYALTDDYMWPTGIEILPAQ